MPRRRARVVVTGERVTLPVMQDCVRLSARLPVATCVTRWKRSGSGGPWRQHGAAEPVYEACRGCMVGWSNARAADAEAERSEAAG